jgi:hypothetical protein
LKMKKTVQFFWEGYRVKAKIKIKVLKIILLIFKDDASLSKTEDDKKKDEK